MPARRREHDPRNDVLTSAKRAEERKHTKYDAICAATGSVFSPFALETTDKHSTVFLVLDKQTTVMALQPFST